MRVGQSYAMGTVKPKEKAKEEERERERGGIVAGSINPLPLVGHARLVRREMIYSRLRRRTFSPPRALYRP